MIVRTAATVVSENSLYVTANAPIDDDRVVEQRHDRARAVAEVEPERDVHHDQQDRVEQRLTPSPAAACPPWRPPTRPGGIAATAPAPSLRVEGPADLGVQADQRHLVGVVLGAAEAAAPASVLTPIAFSEFCSDRRLDRLS